MQWACSRERTGTKIGDMTFKQSTAEALILFHGCKISNIVLEIICKKYIN